MEWQEQELGGWIFYICGMYAIRKDEYNDTYVICGEPGHYGEIVLRTLSAAKTYCEMLDLIMPDNIDLTY